MHSVRITVKKIGWNYVRSYRRYGKNGENMCIIYISKMYFLLRLHAAEPVLSCWKLSTRWSRTAHVTIDLRSRHRINPRPTPFVSGKANESRWWPRRYQVDPWSRRRDVARGVLRSFSRTWKNCLVFTTVAGSRSFVVCFLDTRGQTFYVEMWPAPATYHRSFCEHWPEGGSEPLTSAPRSDFMAQSLVLSIDIYPGLGISPLHLAEFFSGRSAQELFFSGFLKSFKTFDRRFVIIASCTEIFRRVSLKF